MSTQLRKTLFSVAVVVLGVMLLSGCNVTLGPPGGATPDEQEQHKIATSVAETVQAQADRTATAMASELTVTASTDTPAAPTDTPAAATDTPEPPTDTPLPPTDTPAPPTDTPAPPTDTPVPQQADLQVDWIRLNPNPPIQGEPVDVELQVYNHGSARAEGNFTVGWWAGANYTDGPHCTWNVAGMNARGGRVLRCTYGGYPSWYANLETMARADIGNAIDESDEDNNELRMTISVSKPTPTPIPLPNLTITELELLPPTPVQGEPVTVQVHLYNDGNAAVTGNYVVDWWAGVNYVDGPHCTWNVAGENMAPHTGRVLTCTYPGYPSWYAQIETMARADVNNTIHESDESDNELHKFISVSKP